MQLAGDAGRLAAGVGAPLRRPAGAYRMPHCEQGPIVAVSLATLGTVAAEVGDVVAVSLRPAGPVVGAGLCRRRRGRHVGLSGSCRLDLRVRLSG